MVCYRQGHTMRRLIRHRATGKFFSHGAWTRHPHLGQDFADHAAARTAKDQYHLTKVELYYLIGDQLSPAFDFSVPLADAAPEHSRPKPAEQATRRSPEHDQEDTGKHS